MPVMPFIRKRIPELLGYEAFMGTPDAVSRYVSDSRRADGDKDMEFKELTTKITT